MKKIVLFIILFLLVMLMIPMLSHNKNIIISTQNNIEKNNELNEILKKMKDNMDYISINNESLNIKPSWSYYKLELPENQKQIYDYLIRDIRVCYIYFTDDGTTYSDSILSCFV